MKTHFFMCYVENTPFHIFLKIHLFIFMNIKYVCTYIYMYVHTYIGTYIPSEGSEYSSEIFWEIFWYKKFCGKINRDHLINAGAQRVF